ncbi:hypothetical protein Zmor_006327 [Zophobas morio]|uniref:Uncharacterized protein n=1 Tax=Zophobas morio TaxID=2755281 RepID=A0AA38MLC3_9CUCU|nr:hypothetical protein Zmor_006327 [Zophobas morio]
MPLGMPLEFALLQHRGCTSVIYAASFYFIEEIPETAETETCTFKEITIVEVAINLDEVQLGTGLQIGVRIKATGVNLGEDKILGVKEDGVVRTTITNGNMVVVIAIIPIGIIMDSTLKIGTPNRAKHIQLGLPQEQINMVSTLNKIGHNMRSSMLNKDKIQKQLSQLLKNKHMF